MKYIKTGFVLFVCLLLFGCLAYLLITILFKFWGPVLSVIPKLSDPFLDAAVKCLAVLSLTILFCYLAGLLFSTKIRKSIPSLKGMSDLSQRPLVLVKDYPNEGFWAIGIITGKQKFVDNHQGSKNEVRPRVYIVNPSNPTSGHLVFPSKEKIFLIKSSTSSVIQMWISMGIFGPEIIKLETDEIGLDFYYA